MRLCTIIVLSIWIAPVRALGAQTATDSAAVIAAALDYIDGYWERDTVRLRRALHPDLAKRQAMAGRNGGPDRLDVLTTEQMITSAVRSAGRPISAARQSHVQILHMFGNMATVVIDAGGWVDYAHLARWNGEYKIVNIMFAFRREG